MEGWGAIWHKPKGPSTPHQEPLQSLTANTHISVPERGLVLATDAGPQSINQREILAAILGLRSFLRLAQKTHVQLISDSQVTLAVIRNWTSGSPKIKSLLRILRRMCEENGLSLGLQYLPSI
jgi:ribonuclease HI